MTSDQPSPAQPTDEIHTFSHTRGRPSGSRISARRVAVLASSAIESSVATFACPCMFDCPARMNTFSGLAAVWLTIPNIRPINTAIFITCTLCLVFFRGSRLFFRQSPHRTFPAGSYGVPPVPRQEQQFLVSRKCADLSSGQGSQAIVNGLGEPGVAEICATPG